MQRVNSGQLGNHAMAESRLTNERNVLRTFASIAHVEATEKILVLHGNRVPIAIVLKVLEVRLDHGMHVTHLSHEQVLALHHAIEHVVERKRCGRGRCRVLSGCCGRSLKPAVWRKTEDPEHERRKRTLRKEEPR